MPTNENLSVWIEVEGRSLPEFKTTISKQNLTVECWVPSELNKPFEICFHDSIRSYSSAFDIRIDGNAISCGRVVVKSDEETKCPSTRVRGYQLTRKKRQLLYFSRCILLDDSAFSPYVSDRVGQIEVEIERVRLRKTRAAPRKMLIIPPLFLDERAHKGIDHGVQAGEEIQNAIDPYPAFVTQRIEYLGTFIFKYRPMEVLRAKGIAPRIKRLGNIQEIIDLTEEEAAELRQRMESELRELKGMVSTLEQQISSLNGRSYSENH